MLKTLALCKQREYDIAITEKEKQLWVKSKKWFWHIAVGLIQA